MYYPHPPHFNHTAVGEVERQEGLWGHPVLDVGHQVAHDAVHGVLAVLAAGLQVLEKMFINGWEDCLGHLVDLLSGGLRSCRNVVLMTAAAIFGSLTMLVLQASEALLSGGDQVGPVLVVPLCLEQDRREGAIVVPHHLPRCLLQAHRAEVEVPAGPVLGPDHVDHEAGVEAGGEEEEEEGEIVEVEEAGDEAGG